MNSRRRFLAVSLLSCLFGVVAIPTAEAGPLLDWLFKRNRSQSLAGAFGAGGNSPFGATGYGAGFGATGAPNAAGYGAAPQPGALGYGTGYGPGAAQAVRGQNGRGFGSCLTKSCLFGRSGSGYLSNNSSRGANSLASAGQNRTAAGYAPQGSCGPGWCQQTVVKYIPQIAYRTAYQPVPVTTYKTSTSINPANGLPRTCTRPCTSYSYQARRVPYTTYRPVYTTVPVSDTMGGQTAGAPAAPRAGGLLPPAGYGQAGYGQNYALQPPTGGACTACQNGASSAFPGYAQGGGGFGAAPGYTPGTQGILPPAPQTTPWSNQPLATPPGYGSQQANPPGATPWQRVQPAPQAGGSYADSQQATPWRPESAAGGNSPPSGYGDAYGANNSANPPGATPWQQDNGFQTAPPTSGNEADRRPSLRPQSRPDPAFDPSRYGYSDSSSSSQKYLKPVPMPEAVRREINQRRIDGKPDQTQYRDSDRGRYKSPSSNFPGDRVDNSAPYGGPYGSSSRSSVADDQLFMTPNRSLGSTPSSRDASYGYGSRPPLDPPANQEDGYIDFNETRRHQPTNVRGVRDLHRERRIELWSPDNGDSTAQHRAQQQDPRGTKPVHNDEIVAKKSQSRYAAVPIQWSTDSRQDDATRRPTSSSQRGFGWKPIR